MLMHWLASFYSLRLRMLMHRLLCFSRLCLGMLMRRLVFLQLTVWHSRRRSVLLMLGRSIRGGLF
ncbi:MAG TPA: hypothetical protein VGK99_18475 [Acidobacteriota bacterium]